jgi:hypothetical protein
LEDDMCMAGSAALTGEAGTMIPRNEAKSAIVNRTLNNLCFISILPFHYK